MALASIAAAVEDAVPLDGLTPLPPPLVVVVLVVVAVVLAVVLSPVPPPISGDMWLRETCSMKEVPYFRKYHHSKIRMRPEIREDVPVNAT